MKRLQGHILNSIASKGIWLLICLCSLMRAHYSLGINTLNQGDVLNSSDYLVSNNKFFTLGFRGGYLVIDSITGGQNPVWSANRNNPILESFVSIDEFGNFKITNRSGDVFEIYSADRSSVSNATSVTAVLGDDGNLVLKLNQRIVWQSFDHPTDTLLPGMKLGIDKKNGRKWSLTSWLGEDIPTPGAFTLEWDPADRQVIVRRRRIKFWTSGYRFENFPILDTLNTTYKFNIISNADEESLSYSIYEDDSYFRHMCRWFLDYKGNVHGRTGTPIILSSDFCDGNSTVRGCEKWERPAKCRRNGDKFKYSVGNFQPEYVRQDNSNNLSFIDCRDMCWQNCNCTAFYNDGSTGCQFYVGSYGGETLDDGDTFRGELPQMYVLEPGPPPPPPPPPSRKWIWIVMTVTILPTIMLAGTFLYLRWRKLKQEEKFLKELLTSDAPTDANELEDGRNRNQTLKLFSVASIKSATNSFSLENKLGEGGFGPVYKGRLAEGDEIAVKRLSRTSGQGLVEFKNELLLIAKLQHMNLVRLLGFCIQGEERLLVYEYLPNKSLDFFIFGDSCKREALDWNKRFSIIEGIAQGLLYLHKYSRLRIIHRDLKASNILLDKDMNPKISDFGMARIFKANENEANTHRIVGTYGYMSPEYAMSGIFSVKSDVYSFGVLVLEIVSGKKNHNVYDYDRMLNLIGYAWDLWKRDEALELVDPTLRRAAQEDQVLRCINVGLLCVEQKPSDRPNMSDVLSMLTSDVKAELPVPKEPAFFVGQRQTIPSLSSAQEKVPSAIVLSITEMDGR